MPKGRVISNMHVHAFLPQINIYSQETKKKHQNNPTKTPKQIKKPQNNQNPKPSTSHSMQGKFIQMQSEGKQYFSMNSTLSKSKFISLLDAHSQRSGSFTSHIFSMLFSLSYIITMLCNTNPVRIKQMLLHAFGLRGRAALCCVHQGNASPLPGTSHALQQHALSRQRIQEGLNGPQHSHQKDIPCADIF